MDRNKGNSVIAFPREYVVVDIETTGLNFEYDEIIEIAAIRVSDEEIVSSFQSLVRPKQSHIAFTAGLVKELGFESFSSASDAYETYCETHLIPPYIEHLTGITKEMILTAPMPTDILPKFLAFVGGTILVGHNVNFDINFLYDAIIDDSGTSLNNDFIDTMRIARKIFPDLPHHRLHDIAEVCSVTQTNAHRALADCETTMACFSHMKNIVLEQMTESDFASRFQTKKHSFDSYLKTLSNNDLIPDESNPFFSKVVVFTGTLEKMSRKQAMQLLHNIGGVPSNAITQSTNYLVVGNKEFSKSIKEGKSSKMKKVDALALKGYDIRVISEDTFFDLMGD